MWNMWNPAMSSLQEARRNRPLNACEYELLEAEETQRAMTGPASTVHSIRQITHPGLIYRPQPLATIIKRSILSSTNLSAWPPVPPSLRESSPAAYLFVASSPSPSYPSPPLGPLGDIIANSTIPRKRS
ncbi:hypothetical protein H113_07898 [Trichophyton rubrum MR1459]|nr:hypothetical protein H113_07898 [Trichophyton rubrum MR1459]KMQ48906.1 hypothetical protein HL42_0346 [Trichophyton rubrum]